MPVSALVLTLEPGEAVRQSVSHALSQDARLTLGELVGDRLPVVTETATLEEGEDLTEQLLEVPGIRFVDVVSVDFSDLADKPQGSAGRSHRYARPGTEPRTSERR